MSSPDYDTMLVAELRQRLTSAGLPTSGRKVELIERLRLSEQEPTMISIEADLVEENNSTNAFITQMKKQIIGPLNLGGADLLPARAPPRRDRTRDERARG